MNIGICGNESIIKMGILMSENHDFEGCTLISYTPENLILDVEEGYFKCSLLFMDIGLEEFKDEGRKDYDNGIDLIEKVNRKFPHCQVVYIIDNNDFDERVYDTKHAFLMTRSSIIEKMPKALSLVKNNMKNVVDKDVMEIISEGRRMFIHRNEIVCIERDARLIQVITTTKKYPCYDSIKVMLESMDDRMVRINGGCIVHLGYITDYGKGKVEITYGDKKKIMSVGRSYQKSLKEAYFRFWESYSCKKMHK